MITARDICKTFKLYQRPADRLKEILLRRSFHREFRALDQVSFEVAEGETLGIVGQNGAGKSTLLKILTGVLMPDSGTVQVDGRITGLLELGTGFNPEFTGIQNIYMNGTFLGMSRKELDERRDEIIAFSELGDFIGEPLKTYSSGMVMRLAFGVAIHANPKAFVVDEALSVGDAYFQQKCIRKIKEFKENGGAIVFVSHDMNAVKVLCDRALLLNDGRIIEAGQPNAVINAYNFLLARKQKGNDLQLIESACEQKSYGNLRAKIIEGRLLNHHNEPTDTVISGQKCTIELTVVANTQIDELTIGISIQDRFGQHIFGTNTHHLNRSLALNSGERLKISYAFGEFNVGPGKYTLGAAAHSKDVHVFDCFHWIDRLKTFDVLPDSDFFFLGLVRLRPDVSIVSL